VVTGDHPLTAAAIASQLGIGGQGSPSSAAKNSTT